MRIALLGALVAASIGAHAQTPAQFADNAKRAAQDLQQVSVVIQESPPGKFYRTTYRLDSPAWDVKKTDSMLNPVQAVVKATIVGAASDSFSTRDEAERANSPTVSGTKIELTYVPSATGWNFLEGRLYADPLRTWIPVEYGKCSEKKAFICSVVDGFAVKK